MSQIFLRDVHLILKTLSDQYRNRAKTCFFRFSSQGQYYCLIKSENSAKTVIFRDIYFLKYGTVLVHLTMTPKLQEREVETCGLAATHSNGEEGQTSKKTVTVYL